MIKLITILSNLKIPFLCPDIGFLDEVKIFYYFQHYINKKITWYNRTLDKIIGVVNNDNVKSKLTAIFYIIKLKSIHQEITAEECWEIKQLSKNIILHKDYIPQINPDNVHVIQYLESNHSVDSINGKLCKKILEKYEKH